MYVICSVYVRVVKIVGENCLEEQAGLLSVSMKHWIGPAKADRWNRCHRSSSTSTLAPVYPRNTLSFRTITWVIGATLYFRANLLMAVHQVYDCLTLWLWYFVFCVVVSRRAHSNTKSHVNGASVVQPRVSTILLPVPVSAIFSRLLCLCVMSHVNMGGFKT